MIRPNLSRLASILLSVGLLASAQEPAAIETGIARGPRSDEADYRYLSLATPRTGNGYDFTYNLCNLRERKMAFYWMQVGFGMDISDPLPAGLCATYELTQTAPKLEPAMATTLKFSDGSQSVPAYVPCGENESPCRASKESPVQTITAALTGYLQRHLEGKPEPEEPQPNKPTSVVTPLRVVVRVASAGDTKEVQVVWAGKRVSFVACFPDAKLGLEDLKKFVTPKVGGRFEFNTFPAFKGNSNLLLAGASAAAITVKPDDKAESGLVIFQISKGFPATREVLFLVVDESGRAVARLDAPMPIAKR